MKIEFLLLLLAFELCHWAADYTHLSTGRMLAAKAKGTPWLPILEHAMVHGAFVLLISFYVCYPDWVWSFALAGFQVITHFLIDLLKGRLNAWFPRLADPSNKFHWWIFGADQYLHHAVIVITVYCISLIVTF